MSFKGTNTGFIGTNTIKYWLVEVIENDCIVTRVGVYDEISPEPDGNPEGGARGISRYPDLSHNTVILNYLY